MVYMGSIDLLANIKNDGYYNSLDVDGFSQMLKDPSFCYKFYWLEGIVKIISRNGTETTFGAIIDEMICSAWYSVCEFHIHLSGLDTFGRVQDGLERTILELVKLSVLPANASEIEIKNAIGKFENEIKKYKSQLTTNVPYFALSGFVSKPDNIEEWRPISKQSAGRMIAYFEEFNKTKAILPYTFGKSLGLQREIYFHPAWIEMIKDNTVAILGWIQHEKTKWLQNLNPEVPGLVYKLVPMDEKVRKLQHVRELWDGVMKLSEVIDIFTNNPIAVKAYDVDHFIPWSFVMNDELWNLAPMDSSLNSSKSNKLPKWDPFFEKFADNQFLLYTLIHEKPGIFDLYNKCSRDNLHSIWAIQELYRRGNTRDEFYNILEKNMSPVYDSARRQGYELW